MKWQPKHPALQALIRAFADETTPLYVVGGAVRDYLLNRHADQTDIDLVVERAAIPIARRVADRLGWAFYELDTVRDVARLVFAQASGTSLVCDIAAMRGGTLESDLLARDFTVNALAFRVLTPTEVELIDFVHGQADLADRHLRRVSPSGLAEDPVRLLRAVRFVHQLNFSLEDETLIQIKRMGGTIKLASAERIRDELWKILITEQPADAIATMEALGLLSQVLPEVSMLDGVEQSPPHENDVYQHTLEVVRHMGYIRQWLQGRSVVSTPHPVDWQSALAPWRSRLRQYFVQSLAVGHLRSEWLIWHALLHDIGKPVTQSRERAALGEIRIRFVGHERVSAQMASARLEQLRFSRQEIAYAERVAANHMRPHLLHASFVGQPISRRAAYRYFRDSGDRATDHLIGLDICLLALADSLAIHRTLSFDWLDYLTHLEQLIAYAFAADGFQQTRQTPLVDGHQLMRALKLQPGRQVGEILEYLLEAQAAGEVQTAEAALALAHQWLTEQSPP